MREAFWVKHYSYSTEENYVHISEQLLGKSQTDLSTASHLFLKVITYSILG
jgi:hypothetical protein